MMAASCRSVPRLGRKWGLASALCGERWCNNVAGKFHSPVVDNLWAMRTAEGEERASAVMCDPTQPRTVDVSATSITYDFSSNFMLAESYRNPWGFVRMGRILEDLDALAGTIAFKHSQPRAPTTLMHVTASVDRIRILHNCTTEADMTISGKVVWIGRSSMVISLCALSDAPLDGRREPWMTADFTFVARDPKTLKAAPLNPLELRTPDERQTFEQYAERARKQRASREASRDCANVAANASATAELVSEALPALQMPALADPRGVLMSATRQSNAFVCQPQQRNTQNRIFGGLLMRRAYELGFATAFLFAGSRPQFAEVGRVDFIAPVNVGDLLRLDSVVLYTTPKRSESEGTRRVVVRPPEIHVEVTAHVVQPETRTSSTVNTFMFAFTVPDLDEVKRIIPATTDEAARMLARQAAAGVDEGGAD